MGTNQTTEAVRADSGVSAHPRFYGAAHGGGHARMLSVDLPPEAGGDAIAAEWGGPAESLIDKAQMFGGAR